MSKATLIRPYVTAEEIKPFGGLAIGALVVHLSSPLMGGKEGGMAFCYVLGQLAILGMMIKLGLLANKLWKTFTFDP